MPYAITALFDERTEEGIHALRVRLVEAGFGDPASAEVRPHLTLAILPALGGEALREPLRAWCEATPPLPVDIAAVGTFPTAEGVVFLAPVVTAALLDLHAQLQAVLKSVGLTGYETYRADRWVPHVTVGIQFSADAVAGAVLLSCEADVFGPAGLTRVAVAEFPPLRTVYSFALRGESVTSQTGLG
ncbi:MAG: 2'-5' RNA ligase family protein [Anaerolineae bacterium]